jgi:hypothetical protein
MIGGIVAKRFTDTDKWKDAWFTELEPSMKIFWIYLCDTCDHAGIWRVNFRVASSLIGTILDKQSALKALGDRVRVVADDKWFIEKFIKFQYPKGLSDNSKIHQGVINSLKNNNIDAKPYLTLIEGLAKPKQRVQDKDKYKEIDSSFLNKFLKKEELVITNPVNPDALIQLFNDTLANQGKIVFCRGLSKDNLQSLLTTLAFPEFQKLETWKELFSRVAESDFLTGKKGTFVATLNWLVEHDHALKVLNGQYNGTPNEQKGAKSASKAKMHGTAATPMNPTGNPYIQEAIEKGFIA